MIRVRSSVQSRSPAVTVPGFAAIAHAASTEEVARALASDPRHGLTAEQIAILRKRYGTNRLPQRERPAYVALAVDQVFDPLVALLGAAVVVSAAVGDSLEAAVIGAILLLNAALGFLQEAAAERALLALRGRLAQTANVVRDGRERVLPAEELVPGDLVVVREGDRIPADGRLVSAEGLETEEASLTGESAPVEKQTSPVPTEVPLAERCSMVFAGTSVTRGRGAALVTAIGVATELGVISRLADRARPPPTPLQRRLARLVRWMAGLGVALVVALGGVMLLRGESLHESFLLGVAVAVAVVPEGLVATVTIALSFGARAMARRGALVRRLAAIETLGETTVICTDKTGTLTENRMRLAAALPAKGVSERELLAGAVLASSAELIDELGAQRVAGDPIEGALLLAASERGLTRTDLLDGRTYLNEMPFEAERKSMTVVYEEGGRAKAYVKGAPEVLLERSLLRDVERDRLSSTADLWAREGLRVLAVGEHPVADEAQPDRDAGRDLRPLGLVALHDPLRPAAPAAIAEAQSAGINVQMLTGDHPATARAIGKALGLAEAAIHARVTPTEKLRIVMRLQARGEVVGVTGDGVNDAPALRRADVGISMGRSGTEVARDASDIVITDDDFSTIVAALHEGRRIASNVRKVVAFLLSANLGEVVLFAIAVLGGLGVPMSVVQVLTVNVVTDGLPALALTRDVSPWTMTPGPSREPGLFPRAAGATLIGGGTLVGLAGLGAYLVGRELEPTAAQTMSFATVAFAELIFVFAIRSVRSAAWRVPRNPHLTAGVLLSALLVLLVVYVPALHGPFATAPLGASALAVVFGLALLPFGFIEAAKASARCRQG